MDVDTALSEVPVNVFPLTDNTDFKTRETSVAYDAAGMDLVWNFVTTGGAFTQTAVTPTTGGSYDWTHQGDGMYTIEIPASGGASINNDTEGFGWFSGVATGVLPWRGPIIGFRASGINNKLIDDAYSTERGLAGTALPAAAADAAGGLPISDAGGLDLDTLLSTLTNETYGLSAIETLVDELETRLTAARAGYLDELSSANIPADIDTLLTRITDARMGALTDWINGGRLDLLIDQIIAKLPSKNYLAGTSNSDGDIQMDEATGNFSGSVASVTAGVTVSDKTGFSLSSAGIQSVWEYSTRTLSSFGSLVSDIATAVWSAGTRTLTGFGTLIADIWTYATRRLSDATSITSDGNTISQTQLANLDAAITSRLATAGYTAPDNTNIGNIITAINHATYGLNALLTAINTRLATSGYTAPDNASITAILEDTATTIPGLIAALNNLSSVQAQAAAAAALTAYDPPTKAEMDAGHALLATAASIAALNNISTAQVLAQATAALEATITEPDDLTNLSAKGILYHLFSRFFHRNTQTATAQVTYKANGTTALATRTASDDGTTQELGKAT